jgi:translation initiation factor IF-2
VLRAKPTLELRRKPVRAGTDEGASSTAPTRPGAAPVEVGVPELKRPAPPKAKRGKSWEEEEEEQETPKTAKTTKGKRRTVVVDDEDLDLDEALDHANGDEAASTLASITLARPPKPKNRPGQTRPAAIAAPAQRAKKPSAPSERGNRRDRREQESKEKPEIITLTHGLTVAELADVMAVPETEIIKTLFMKGIMTTVNQILDVPTATMVAEEMGVLVETGTAQAEAKKVTEMLDASDMEKLQRRPPVVTIMGHVDHGKTTLLDSIRKTKVAAGEAGGITQHIGAYHVDVDHNGQTEQVVFLDTPGHEAFTAMRARGARVTDVAVLVVAADDGVRPQTIEAISHAKAAEVPIVVAINKVDKEDAQPDRVKQELTEFGLVAEEWGGDTIMVPVSALTGENLDTLLEMLLLVSEVEDLYANPDRPARGTVIEANLDKARGPVATLLIQNGTLKVGDILVAGSAFGKVRAMIDDRSKRVDIASPSFAVEVLGLSDVPAAGDEFEVYLDEKEARSVASNRMDQQRLSRLQQAMASRRVSLNSLSAQAQEGDLKELNLILKADVQGSVEAILAALQQLPQKEVQVRVLLAAPGEITETDVDLAAASNAVIVGFNTTFASGARQAADDAGVDVRDYNIIYKLLEDIQGAMEGLLEPELVEEPLGQVEVRAVFAVGRGAVAGCYVQSGKAIRNCRIRVRRGSEAVFEGNLDSLKRMKDDVKEVNAGYECGIGIDNFKDWQEGDIIETFRLATKRRTLSA